MRLIDADALLEALADKFVSVNGNIIELITNAPTVQREEVPSYEMVLSYLYALDNEVKRRGGMFPQDTSAQDRSRDALYKTADSIKFYGKQGYPKEKSVLELKARRAINSAAPKE
jgi:hypothetical protein